MYSPETNTEAPLETANRRKRFPLGALLLGVLFGWVLLSLFSHAAKVGVWNRLAGMMTAAWPTRTSCAERGESHTVA